jgi:hypothetical protein
MMGNAAAIPFSTPLDIDVDDLIPLIRLQRAHRGHGHHTRVVEDDIDAPEFLVSECDEVLHALSVRDIYGTKIRDAAAGPNLRDDLFSRDYARMFGSPPIKDVAAMR